MLLKLLFISMGVQHLELLQDLAPNLELELHLITI